MKIRVMAAIAVALFAFVSTADARPHRHHTRHHRQHAARVVAEPVQNCRPDNNGRVTCSRAYDANANVAAPRGYAYDGRVIGGRPAGCPHAFCGCEASLYKFGRIIPELNLAYNWIRKFPRTQAAPGMAAARSGHVMILISQVSGSNWLVHDGNGGRHRTWEHVRSIAGYVIVNPDATRVAAR